MPEATMQFSHCRQDSQDYGSDDEHMVSRVFFSIEAGGTTYPDLMCDVKQAVGEPFESAPLEVSRPRGYDGSLDYASFRQAVEDYYRSLVGSSGSAIRVEGASNIRMRNNLIQRPHEVSVSYTEDSAAW